MNRKIYYLKTFIVALIISLLPTNCALSQNNPLTSENDADFDLIGVIILESGDLFSYRIVFDNKNGIINGYSYTDISGPNETKSAVKGTYNKKSKELDIKEYEIIYTKSSTDPNDFCFVSVNSKIKLSNKKYKLNGDFTGFDINGDTCATGNVKLMSSKVLEEKITNLYQKAENKDFIDDEVKDKMKPEVLLKEFQTNILKSNDRLSMSWNTNKVVIEVWDNMVEDGDIIEIMVNGEVILKNYTLVKEKKRIFFMLKEGKNEISIKAINLGDNAPNTAKINIIDGEKQYNFVTVLREKEISTVYITKK